MPGTAQSRVTPGRWVAALVATLGFAWAASSRAVSSASETVNIALVVMSSTSAAVLAIHLARFRSGVLFLLVKIVVIPASLIAATMFTCGALVYQAEEVARITTARGEFVAYRMDCGAMCDFSVEVRREFRILPGLRVARSLPLPRPPRDTPCGVGKEDHARFELSPDGQRLVAIIRNYKDGGDCPYVIFDQTFSL